MPIRSLRPCSTAGCSGLAADRFCPKCKSNGVGDGRPTAAERGYDGEWRRYRTQYLREHPHCVDPFRKHIGLIVPASVVDHIKPHHGNKELFWDENNHQGVCKSCHDYKTATQDGGFGRSQCFM
jgi:5-methylcytosine-specific restriction protein A